MRLPLIIQAKDAIINKKWKTKRVFDLRAFNLLMEPTSN